MVGGLRHLFAMGVGRVGIAGGCRGARAHRQSGGHAGRHQLIGHAAQGRQGNQQNEEYNAHIEMIRRSFQKFRTQWIHEQIDLQRWWNLREQL